MKYFIASDCGVRRLSYEMSWKKIPLVQVKVISFSIWLIALAAEFDQTQGNYNKKDMISKYNIIISEI